MAFTKVAAVSEIPPGELVEIMHEGEAYAVCNVGGKIRALTGTCPHQGGPLGQGALEGPMITCPWHCWQFDSATGLCIFGDDVDAIEGVTIATYPVRVEGSDVYIDFSENA
jgi:nitrite reductase (NADH) small subunit